MIQTGVKDFPTYVDSEEVAALQTKDFLLLFNSFFGFHETPFNNTPDPNFFFNSQKHQEALFSLKFGVEQRRGFVVLSGEIGAGKTTLCREFLTQLSPEIKTAVILNPKISVTHLWGSMVQDFGIKCKGKTKKDYFNALNQFLIEGLERNQNACLIIDEVQCLNAKVLEEIRLISNLETSKQKLLQIVLIGQPELQDILRKPSLTQLRQRIGVFVHLKGLAADETENYIRHRIDCVSDGSSVIIFDNEVFKTIHEITRGIPRLVNTACDRILMAAFAKHTKQISMETAEQAFEEIAFICGK